MEIPAKVLEIADGIKAMRIRGAGKIARSAAEALKIAALEYSGPNDEKVFRKYMAHVADLLISTRPTAVSLPNAVYYVMYRLMTSSGSVKELRETVARVADQFIVESLEAVRRIGEIGARRIKYGSTILTHCHSTAAVSVIVTAYKMGRIERVYSTDKAFLPGKDNHEASTRSWCTSSTDTR